MNQSDASHDEIYRIALQSRGSESTAAISNPLSRVARQLENKLAGVCEEDLRWPCTTLTPDKFSGKGKAL